MPGGKEFRRLPCKYPDRPWPDFNRRQLCSQLPLILLLAESPCSNNFLLCRAAAQRAAALRFLNSCTAAQTDA